MELLAPNASYSGLEPAHKREGGVRRVFVCVVRARGTSATEGGCRGIAPFLLGVIIVRARVATGAQATGILVHKGKAPLGHKPGWLASAPRSGTATTRMHKG